MQKPLIHHRLRIATFTDASAIARLHAANWRNAYLDGDIVAERTAAWEERFRAPAANQYVVVAEIGQDIVGFACVYGDDDSLWGNLLENLHVSHAHKRQGIGARLMADMAQWCMAHCESKGLFLWVVEQNTPARRFYEQLGAADQGRDIWSSPDGGAIPKLRYVWQSVAPLLAPANPPPNS